MMTTTTVPIQIACPAWCTVSAEDHVAELWNAGGNCNHHAADITVADPTGHIEALSEPRLHDSICLSLSAVTAPDGREIASPTFRIDEAEHSLDQMLALADAIHRIVNLYRSQGSNS